ncbi:hypothetical protein LTR62_003902 [Meristemomyces frigidus]|uniref:C2H2-type domain-containing protein n=1 Tax=Meristemomyces frigidus TaxID=1508187 RepID=A0AAN7TR70_9PEZI|nr:hypothetical protein LTR62_003902 [Meristemomyces frigidus]
MSRYNYNTNSYYDPVGSQQPPPTGYTYGQDPALNSSGAPSYSAAATRNYSTGPSSASYQGYGSSTAGRATNTMGNLHGPEHSQSTSANTAGTPYNGSSWNGTNSYEYGTNLQMPNRVQSNNSPAYTNAAAASNTYGQLSAPEQTQSTATAYANTAAAASHTYGQLSALEQTQSTTKAYGVNQSYPSAAQQGSTTSSTSYQSPQPQRYNSPLHTVQAQKGHAKQSSRPANHHDSSSRMSQVHRQGSASVEPQAPTMTVDPSQVYDDTAERRRKAQVEAERKRKRDEELAVRKAEEGRIAAEAVKRKEEEKLAKHVQEVVWKKVEAERKAEQLTKAREEKKQSKSAASALQKMASSSAMAGGDDEAPPANAEEAEMRAMFKKMREFNAKNPTMLAQLWEEERKTHATQAPSQSACATRAAPPIARSSTASTAVAAKSGVRPFQKPRPPGPLKQAKANPAITKTPVWKSAMPITTQTSNSLWPPQKKGSLAEWAAKWLISIPENQGKIVSRDEVLRILDGNPSYVQLCEALEGLGLHFERSALARELLDAVPGGTTQQVIQPTPPANGFTTRPVGSPAAKKKGSRPLKDPTGPATVAYDTPSFTSLSDAAKEVNAMHRHSRQPPAALIGGPVQPLASSRPLVPSYLSPGAPVTRPTQEEMRASYRAPSVSTPKEVKPDLQSEAPSRPPANKEEAARKRNFGDLIDLTAQDSDDDEPPAKIMNVQMGSIIPSINQPQSRPTSSVQLQPPLAPANTRHSFSQPINANDFYKRPNANVIVPGMDMRKPSIPWGALPLPPVISSMQPNFAPPMQSPQPPRSKGPSLETKQHDRIRGRMLVEPIMRDRVARKNKYDTRTIARDVLLATGKHPDMRGLNSHLNPLLNLLAHHGGSGGSFDDGQRGNRSDLSTIRWDIIDPELPSANARKVKIPALITEDTADADDEDDEPAAIRTVQQARDNGDGTTTYVSVNERVGSQKIKKRLGRPPRHSLPGTINIAHSDTPARQVVSGQTTTPSTALTGTALGYSAFRKLDENGNPIKTKGRPVGWRKSVHSREAQGLTPPKPGASRGPKKNSTSTKPLVEAEPQIWYCLWRDCDAQLHNQDTLKKHVVKIHGRANERQYECLWRGCDAVAAIRDVGKGKGKLLKDEEGEFATFPDLKGWLWHVDDKHLRPIAKRQGDGPKGGVASNHNATDSEAYLSDAQGRSVTPIIRPTSEPLTNIKSLPAATSRVRPRSMRALALAPGLTREEREAAGDLAQLERHKGLVGVRMAKTGATFAIRKRVQGLIDDEDFEDVVETEDEHYGDGGVEQ